MTHRSRPGSASISERKEVLEFAEGYKTFMASAKTELSFVTEAIRVARDSGFRELNPNSNLRSGARFYDVDRDYNLRHALRNMKVVSADVNPGVHPSYAGVWEAGNAPRLGFGINLKLYGGGFNANSEFIAWNRAYLDDAGVAWQTATYKGKASGGTIGKSMSKDNMEVIDCGVPLLSIHSTYALSSKVDVHMLFRAMDAFCRYEE